MFFDALPIKIRDERLGSPRVHINTLKTHSSPKTGTVLLEIDLDPEQEALIDLSFVLPPGC